MKERTSLAIALAFVLFAVVTRSPVPHGHIQTVEAAPHRTVTVTLAPNSSLPDLNPGDTLDFILPGANAGTSYWIKFKNKTPCKHLQALLQGTPDTPATRPHCDVKAAITATQMQYGYSYGTGSSGAPTMITDGIILCKHC